MYIYYNAILKSCIIFMMLKLFIKLRQRLMELVQEKKAAEALNSFYIRFG